MTDAEGVPVEGMDRMAALNTAIARSLYEHVQAFEWTESRVMTSHRVEADEHLTVIVYRLGDGKPKGVFADDDFASLLKEYHAAFAETFGYHLDRMRLELRQDGSFRVVYPQGELPDFGPRWAWPDEPDYKG